MGSATFTVEVTSASPCALTARFVHGSDRYARLHRSARRIADVWLGSVCRALTHVHRNARPPRAHRPVRGYQRAVHGLARAGWLTDTQAQTLSALAEGLLDA